MMIPRQQGKTIAYLLVFCFLAVARLAADEGDMSRDALRKGSWSLQFGVGSNFTLNNFQGATFSGKYHLSVKSVLRAGIAPVYRRQSAASGNYVTQESRSSGISLAVHYLYYLRSPKRLNGYLGGGPEFGFERDRNDPNFSNYTDNKSIGATFILGAEWFATKDISLFAEYAALLFYSRRTAITNGHEVGRSNNSSFGARNVVLGLTVYL